MDEAVKQIETALEVDRLPRSENGVFISYAHEDRYIALPLFDRLHAAGINVWFDEEKLESGAEYERRIRHAIDSCKVFMPILSSQVRSDLVSGRIGSRWYHQEWEWAQARRQEETSLEGRGQSGFRVIPVVVGDYRFNEAYHRELPPCILEVTAFEAAKDSIDRLIGIINA